MNVRPMQAGDAEAVADAEQMLGWVAVTALIASTEAAGTWTIQSGVFPENAASLALHERAGFRVVGTRERLGRQAARGDRWRDVVLLERRSPRAY